MDGQRSQLLGKGCLVGGAGLLAVAILGWLFTVVTGSILGTLAVAAVPPGVGMLLAGSVWLDYRWMTRVIVGLILVSVAVSFAILLPVIDALNLDSVIVLLVILVMALVTMAGMNSQELRTTGVFSGIDDTKGYDGRSDEREWIPSEEELDERAKDQRDK